MTTVAIGGSILSSEIRAWLDHDALLFDRVSHGASAIVPTLGRAGLFGIGVPRHLGGDGATLADGVRAIAAVSARSLTAGFVFWGHRTFIEYLLQSPNARLREKLLPDLLAGRRAGATGLSNAMKFLNGLEALQVTASRRDGTLCLDGKLPWVTNLRKEGFDVAAAVQDDDSKPAFIVSLSSDDDGLVRTADLDLMAMRASNTAAIAIDRLAINEDRIIHPNAGNWLPRVRPAFLGLQCGMSIGLAHRSLCEVDSLIGNGGVLAAAATGLTAELAALEEQLLSPLDGPFFIEQPVALFQLRIRLAEIVNQSLQLELGATGGKAYLSAPGEGYQRRLRESAFIPVVTPSLVQLETVIEAHRRRAAEREIA
ncbi:acyl-CoA dehydrogenase family protein [Bradyrhizobium cytisi]|uniref:Acyl-CoA dehydrogenase n=1 Tax=Bradyrhizobium cytisi TaxID=515489 RepID=A0A5S4WWX4_9BRAD|nr:acyl-CoA dehydrogenase family protein [Bradyrhizobium cytisi]TYL85847.1 acyl-CoA dehydrogenase [Bradyrhizobium cytisi]